MYHTSLYLNERGWHEIGGRYDWDNNWIIGDGWTLGPSGTYLRHGVMYYGQTKHISGIECAFEDFPEYRIFKIYHYGGKAKHPSEYRLEFVLEDNSITVDRIGLGIIIPRYSSTCQHVRFALADYIALNAARINQ